MSLSVSLATISVVSIAPTPAPPPAGFGETSRQRQTLIEHSRYQGAVFVSLVALRDSCGHVRDAVEFLAGE
ncbi:hypothetical protein E2C01_049890 [Portunus trituberculatus]|uniref:Uncharacterized protein n=1 Tax=Portunus trituberculatus TaxID=210409 RepID=A0A5B7GAN0_PORTR|nr:hypothetical protein [Portunus trituberculatus]